MIQIEYPSPGVSDVVVEQYNTTLSIGQFLENSDETFVIDNGALHNISPDILKQQAKYGEINWVLSLVMRIMNSFIGASVILILNGKFNGDLHKMGINLVPLQRLHFFVIGQAQLVPGDAKHVKVTANVKAEDGEYL